jgi:Cu/Ag efflux protein CusF
LLRYFESPPTSAETMLKPAVPILMLCLAVATSAAAQSGPGRGGGRPSGGASRAATHAPKAPKPVNKIEIIGVVQALDPDAKRVTIAYEAVDELGWPHGTMPFAVYSADQLKTVQVGQKVRFKLDGQQIAAIGPY